MKKTTVDPAAQHYTAEQPVRPLSAELQRLVDEQTKELLQSEQKYHAIFDNSADAIFILDSKGNCVETNQESCKRYGYLREEILGKGIRQIESPDDRVNVPKKLARLKREGQVIFEKVHLTRAGRKIPTEISAHQVIICEQTLFVCTCRDVTGRTQLVEDLHEAKEAAEAANRAKSDFLAVMSHEIRTPMNGIIGMTQLLQGSNFTVEQREYLNAIKVSADNLLYIINDILDFSRIESGQVELEHTGFSLRTVVEEALKPQLIKIQSKGLTLDVDIDEAAPDNLSGDPLRLKQIIINLVANAIKFTAEGGIRIVISLEASTDGQALLHFRVSDSGIGISPEVHNRIFTPFTQADSSTTRKYGGTGLGLTISRHLAELMKGKLWAESQPGAGSTFHFTARFGMVAPPTAKRAVPAAASQKSLLNWEGRSLHILLAEDHDINRTLSVAILKRQGHTVNAAENGRKALENAERERFDIILMDVEMPEMDGRQATRQIRELEKRGAKRIPIIALTAHAIIGNREEFMESGFDGYVSKPIDFNELNREIRRVVALNPA